MLSNNAKCYRNQHRAIASGESEYMTNYQLHLCKNTKLHGFIVLLVLIAVLLLLNKYKDKID